MSTTTTTTIIPDNIMRIIFEAGLAPEGDYNLVIDDVKVKNDINIDEIDDEHGNLTIIVDFSILDDNYKGYKVKSVLSIFNQTNKQAALAMRKSFSTMLSSLGISAEKNCVNGLNIDILIKKQLKAHVIKEPANNNFPAYNRATIFLTKSKIE